MDIHIVETAMENMYARSGCARLNHLKKAIRSTPEYLKHVEERKPFQVRILACPLVCWRSRRIVVFSGNGGEHLGPFHLQLGWAEQHSPGNPRDEGENRPPPSFTPFYAITVHTTTWSVAPRRHHPRDHRGGGARGWLRDGGEVRYTGDLQVRSSSFAAKRRRGTAQGGARFESDCPSAGS